MGKKNSLFPDDFLWGSASAAYQIEGAAFEDGKKSSVWDNFVKIPGKTFKNTNGDIAVDHYHKYQEDIKLMKKMGLKSYRFSISWARILPNGRGEVNQKGVEYYSDLIDTLLKNEIEPIITIYHWDLPQNLYDLYGGWESRNIINDFVNYSEILFRSFGDRVKYWVTLNEQNIFTYQGWVTATHPPGKTDLKQFYQVNHHANLANAAAIKKFHDLKIPGMIGPSFAYGPQYALDCNPLNILAAENAEEFLSNFWLDIYLRGSYPVVTVKYLKELNLYPETKSGDFDLLKSGRPDFLGINYYQTNTNIWDSNESKLETIENKKKFLDQKRRMKGFRRVENQFLNKTSWDWEIDPVGLKIGLRRITSRYNIPVMITENGLGEFDKIEQGIINDHYRITYLESHLIAIKEAIEDGCDVIGYHTWSFTDLLSWLNGYEKRYGFVYIDQDETMKGTLKRTPKESFYWYKKVIDTNGGNL